MQKKLAPTPTAKKLCDSKKRDTRVSKSVWLAMPTKIKHEKRGANIVVEAANNAMKIETYETKSVPKAERQNENTHKNRQLKHKQSTVFECMHEQRNEECLCIFRATC